MSAASARTELTSFIVRMLEIGAAVDSNPPVVRSQRGTTIVVWSSAPKYATQPRTTPFGSFADYRRLLEDRQYNLVLSDGSLIQAFLAFRHDSLVKHSICYYPCPVQLPIIPFDPSDLPELVDSRLFGALETCEWLPSTLHDVQQADQFEDQDDRGEGYALRMRAPLRFDFDPEAATPFHPTSHLHLGDSESRIPVSAPLSMGAFIRFIFHIFYPSLWASERFLQEWPVPASQRCITREQELGIYMDWRS
jgi:hypothetical protein